MLRKTKSVMFADNNNLFFAGINVDDLFSNMNCERNKISLWFKANELSLILTKTKYSLFHPASKKILREPLTFLKMDQKIKMLQNEEEQMLQNFLKYLLMKTSHGNST